jgi:hypothetical protein
MPSTELEAEVARLAVAYVAHQADLGDGWRWAWLETASRFGRFAPGGEMVHGVQLGLEFDRDRAGWPRASALAGELEAVLRAALPALAGFSLDCSLQPTTRLERVVRLVEEEVDDFVRREAARFERAGERWLFGGRVRREVGWTAGQDLVVIEFDVDSSADEGAGRQVGEAAIAPLVTRQPELGPMIRVDCLSH